MFFTVSVRYTMKVNALADVAVPPGAVTATSAAPAVRAGVVAVMDVALFTVNALAAVPPNDTAVAPVKLVPVRVTEVPPVVGPVAGETAVIVGAVSGAS
jgi:hypothetical protein